MKIDYYIGKGGGWIRLNGHGIAVKNVRKHRLSFSERNGIIKYLKIGKYVFTRLKPNRI